MIKALLVFSVLNSVALGVLFTFLFKRKLARNEHDVIIDAVDLVRAHLDTQAAHTLLEHDKIFKMLSTMSGRLQFLLAKEIAEELEWQKEDKIKRTQATADAAAIMDLEI